MRQPLAAEIENRFVYEPCDNVSSNDSCEATGEGGKRSEKNWALATINAAQGSERGPHDNLVDRQLREGV